MSAESGRKESGTAATRLSPNVPLCVTLKQLLVLVRSPARDIYSSGTSLLTRRSVLLYEIRVSPSQALFPASGKVPIQSLPPSEQGRGGSLMGWVVGCVGNLWVQVVECMS